MLKIFALIKKKITTKLYRISEHYLVLGHFQL